MERNTGLVTNKDELRKKLMQENRSGITKITKSVCNEHKISFFLLQTVMNNSNREEGGEREETSYLRLCSTTWIS